MTTGKKWALSLSIVFAILIGITVGGGFYMISYALDPEIFTPQQAEKLSRKRWPQINPWLDSLQTTGALKDTVINAPDGTPLHAVYAKAPVPTDRTAVIVHGYTDQAFKMLQIGYMYNHDLGFNILLPDLRHAGLTPGPIVQMGWLDRLDVIQWINEAPSILDIPDMEIVVHGISMGGATTMMVSGEKLPETVRCFVDDCGYTSAWAQFKKELKEQFGLPPFPLLHMASWICDMKYGWNFKEASALEQVKKCDYPMFFIHGDQDKYVPTWMVYDLYEAKSEPKELWISEGAEHNCTYDMYPDEYAVKVKAFTDKYMQ